MIKSTALWNAQLTEALARVGHGELIVIADAGLPRPVGVPVIDLALIENSPSVEKVLKPILADGVFEASFLAEELTGLPHARGIESVLAPLIPQRIAHEELKALAHSALVFVRSGDARPFSNVILKAGVLF